MHKVTSASFNRDLFLLPSALENSNYLPQLERLEFDGVIDLGALSNKKPITHLVYKPYRIDIPQLHHILGQTSGVLLHLSMEQLLYTLPNFIEANPGLYQNLRHFGTLHFSPLRVRGLFQGYGLGIYSLQFHRDSARASIQSLSCLPNLVSIELRILTHRRISIDQTDPHSFDDRINRQARGLAPIQKIYVTALTLTLERSYWIWEMGSQWESRKVSGISSWEIMNGDL
jgi:hypothetical protein